MTLPAGAIPFGHRLPTDDERAAADQLRRIIAANATEDSSVDLEVIDGDGARNTVMLSPAMSALLLSLLRQLSKGNSVTLVPVSEMLTTQQAADLLNVSRPYLIKLIDQGALSCTMVGRHRRLRAIDVFEYKSEMQQRQDKALDALADIDGAYI